MTKTVPRHDNADDIKLIITLGFSALLILMLTLVTVSLVELNQVTHSISTLVRETNAKSQAANQMRNAIIMRSNTLKAMYLEHDAFTRDDFAQQLLIYAAQYRIARENLLTQPMSRAEHQLHQTLTQETRLAQPPNERLAEMIIDDAPAAQIDAMVKVASDAQNRVLVLLDQLAELERQYADEALRTGEKRYLNTRQTLFALAAFGLLLALVIAALVIQRAANKNHHIIHQAKHDALTGLINRREIEQQLEDALNDDTAKTQSCTLLFIDLDRFKLINDTCGHQAGDHLLKQVSRLLSVHFDESDTLARHGSDEFAALVRGRTLEDVHTLAEMIIQTLQHFRFHWQEHHFTIAASIGMVPIHGQGGSLYELLAAADTACYMAKQKGGNRVTQVSLDDHLVTAHRHQADCVKQVQQALVDDSFILYGQPVVAMQGSGDHAGHIELLLRMRGTANKLISPGIFIPAAERYGLMPYVDRWVVQNALQVAARFSSLTTLPTLMINLSGQSISDDQFLAFVEQSLRYAKLPPGTLCFEITETAAVADLQMARRFIETLKPLGCQFALDDFGTGFSSFSYLKTLPVDYLKIDGSFVKDVVDDSIDLAMVRSINDIGHVLHKQTIAEFVENDAILEQLRPLGIDYVQGFGIAKPQPLSHLLKNYAETAAVLHSRTSREIKRA